MEKQSKRIKNEIRHFNDLEHIWWGAKTTAGQRRYDNKFILFKSLCRPSKNKKILEIGCGDGEFTKRLAKLNCKIFASDITPKVIEKAKKEVKHKKIKFLIDNAESMKFKDQTFDIVCGISVLHHINIEKAFKESFRVLKNGGQIFFTEPNLLNPHIFLGLHIPLLRKRMEFSDDETALMRWQVESSLEKVGFRNVLVKNYDFLHPKTPKSWIKIVENISLILEHTPIIREISGSLLIWAKK